MKALHTRFRGSQWPLAAGAALLALLLGGCPPFTDIGGGSGNGNANNNGSTDTPKGDTGLTGQFVGSTRCMTCHKNQHTDWAETLHARAYETLEKIGRASDASCVGCHTVGFGQTGGFIDRATTNDLASVGCESCHGPGRQHVENVNDAALRPPKSISSEVCATCHTGSHHPHFEDWQGSAHDIVTPSPAASFTAGTRLNECGKCHSGDFFYRQIISGETVADDALKNVAAADQHAVECAICHDPHRRTGNAPTPEDGRDFQLRWPEVANPIPTNTIDAVTNPARFNLCGQCHHDRGRTWQETSRPPHHSNQANMYVGEMPLPEDGDILVLSQLSVHSAAPEQCATCHMYRQDFQSDIAPAISGHTFAVDFKSCATACHTFHPTQAQAEQAYATLRAEVDTRLERIKTDLNAWATTTFGVANGWEYRSTQTAIAQTRIPDWAKQVRFLYYYVLNDGSHGMHNPDYATDILTKCEQLIDENVP